MIRLALVLGTLSALAFTSWTAAPERMVADGILPGDVTIDAWEGLCSQADALGDSLLRFPCAVGWGAGGAPQQDSIRAGVGRVKVWLVTDPDSSDLGGAGSLAAAIDSAAAYDDGKTCSYILIPEGGAYRQHESNWDDISCVRFAFQTAQGEGAAVYNGRIRARSSTYVMFEYYYSRRPVSGQYTWPTSVTDMMCSSGLYFQHGSASWGNTASGTNLVNIGCGTEVVPEVGEEALDVTFHRMLVGEPDSAHVTHMMFQALTAEQARRGTLLENAIVGPGHRCPRADASDTVSIVRNLVYNCVGQYAESGNLTGKADVIDNLFIPGPASPAASDTRRWAYTFVGSTDLDTTFTSFMFIGNRAPRSGYDETMHPDSFVFGSTRDVMIRCANVTWCTGDGQEVVPGMIRYDTLPTAQFANAEIEFGTVMDSVVSGKILAIAGNSRYLACNGQWTLRSDSVDVRFRQQVLDSAGPSAVINTVGGARSYGVPASGTACLDSDSDGLPDEWEFEVTGDSTGIAPDSLVNARPAIEWYLAGRNLDGALIGQATATFGAVTRYVYFVPVVTLFGLSFPDFSPLSAIRLTARNAAGDTMMVLTCSNEGVPADSATVHARLTAWNLPTLNTAVSVRDHTPFAAMEC